MLRCVPASRSDRETGRVRVVDILVQRGDPARAEHVVQQCRLHCPQYVQHVSRRGQRVWLGRGYTIRCVFR